jgi:hypothetical protein
MPGYIQPSYKVSSGIRNVELTYTPAQTLPEEVKLAMVRWAFQFVRASDCQTNTFGSGIKRLRMGTLKPESAGAAKPVPSGTESGRNFEGARWWAERKLRSSFCRFQAAVSSRFERGRG